MKLTRSFILIFSLTASAFFSCKSDSIKDKLVKEWKLVDIGGKTAGLLKDSAKQQMLGNRFMEFRKEGDMIATGGNSQMQRGDYSVSDDGKTIFTSRNGRASDTFLINKLTTDTLIISIKRANLELTWVPK